MPGFARYIGIDYSGAETPIASLKSLRVYLFFVAAMADTIWSSQRHAQSAAARLWGEGGQSRPLCRGLDASGFPITPIRRCLSLNALTPVLNRQRPMMAGRPKQTSR